MDKITEFLKWFFDGFGTQAFFFIVGLCGIGGFIWFRRNKSKQVQKGGDSSEQEQIFTIDSSAPAKCNKEKENNVVIQKQVAGNNTKQTQIGVIKHGN